MAKIEHAVSAPQDGSQTVVEPLRSTIARSAHEVVSYQLQPVRQRFAEGCQRLQPRRGGLFHPRTQALGPGRCILDAAVLEDGTQGLTLLDQLLQPREALL